MVWHVELATPKVVDENVLPPGRMVGGYSRQDGGEEVEERLDPHGREPIGQRVDDLRSRMRVVGDVVG